jgi:cytoskeleton protein RodZ
MGSFGENLRRERELRGVTLAEIANATKINPRYLRALEEEQFEILPGGIFGRGFVRSVCRYMKLDENHWVGEFARTTNQPPETLARLAPPHVSTPGSGPRAKWSFILLVILFGVAAYMVHDLRNQRAAEASPPRKHPAAEAGVIPVADTQTVRAKSGELNLQIDVLDEAWLRVNLDGDTAFEGIMKAGDTRSFRARRQIELVTGNASAVVLTLNSETLAPLGNPGERKTVVLTAADLRSSTP